MKKLLTVLLMSSLTQTAFSQSPADEVQAKLNAIRTMSANFSQQVTAGKRKVSNSSGHMALSRPGKFLWQTESPMQQKVVADGKHLWVYDVELEQVTVKKQEKGLGGTPALFLSGYGNTVTRDFEVKPLSQASYELKAKSPNENYQRLKLTFDGEKLTHIEFFDQLGQHTVVKLNQVKQNPKLSEKLFQFKPPKGADVVKQ